VNSVENRESYRHATPPSSPCSCSHFADRPCHCARFLPLTSVLRLSLTESSITGRNLAKRSLQLYGAGLPSPPAPKPQTTGFSKSPNDQRRCSTHFPWCSRPWIVTNGSFQAHLPPPRAASLRDRVCGRGASSRNSALALRRARLDADGSTPRDPILRLVSRSPARRCVARPSRPAALSTSLAAAGFSAIREARRGAPVAPLPPAMVAMASAIVTSLGALPSLDIRGSLVDP